jgi:hypothetical protein
MGVAIGLGLAYKRSGGFYGWRGSSSSSSRPWSPPGFVFTGDPQLDTLLQLKAAVDPTGVLDGLWEREAGRRYGFCK